MTGHYASGTPSRSQFSSAPRFATPRRQVFSAAECSVQPADSLSHQAAPLSTARSIKSRHPLTRVESIDDTSHDVENGPHGWSSNSDGDEETSDGIQSPPSKSSAIKANPTRPINDGTETWTFEAAHSPSKRRKLYAPSINPPTPRFMQHHHQQRAEPLHARAPPFASPSVSTSTSTTRTDNDVNVPVPYPDIFSPSRRTDRDVPGGLAAQLRGWIAEAASEALAVRAHESDVRELTDGCELELADENDGCRVGRVCSVSSDGDHGSGGAAVTFARTVMSDDGDGMPIRSQAVRVDNVLLVGNGRGTYKPLACGSQLRIWPPHWTVDLAREQCFIVAVDWSSTSSV